MLDRRSAPRVRVDQAAHIAVDEHRSLACLVFDRSACGIRVALPNADLVPPVFLLTVDEVGEALVCEIAWRRDDEIGASFLSPAQNCGYGLRRRPIAA